MMSFRHFFTSYFTHASEGIFGIKSHQSLLRSTRVNLLYRLGLFPLVWGLVMLIRSRKRMARHLGILLTVAVGYWAVVFAENYSVYRATRVFGAGLQGRYLFPALVPGLVFFVWLGLDFLPPRWRRCVATGMALIFVGCSFPFLIRYFGPEWYWGL